MARELRTNSLRARYGEDTVRNALHCSDLPDDGPLEVSAYNPAGLLCLHGGGYHRTQIAIIFRLLNQLIT